MRRAGRKPGFGQSQAAILKQKVKRRCDMEFSLPIQPQGSATLLDNPTHWLRSVVQFKWSIAERELHRFRISVAGKDPAEKADMRRDLETLWREKRKDAALRPLIPLLSSVRDAYKDVVDERNTLVHGSIELDDFSCELHVPDASQSVSGPSLPFHKPGTVVMARGQMRLTQDAKTLRDVNVKMDALLQSIYELWVASDPVLNVEVNAKITEATPSNIGFDSQGKKEATFSGSVKLQQILATESVDHYACSMCRYICYAKSSDEPVHCGLPMTRLVWTECPECDIVAVENGQMCWHMQMSRYYERDDEPLVQINFDRSFLVQLLSELEKNDAKKIHIAVSLASNKYRVSVGS